MSRKCCVVGCKSGRIYGHPSEPYLFKLPKSRKRLEEWLPVIGRYDLLKKIILHKKADYQLWLRVCENHFNKHEIINNFNMKVLVPQSVPHLNLPKSGITNFLHKTIKRYHVMSKVMKLETSPAEVIDIPPGSIISLQTYNNAFHINETTIPVSSTQSSILQNLLTSQMSSSIDFGGASNILTNNLPVVFIPVQNISQSTLSTAPQTNVNMLEISPMNYASLNVVPASIGPALNYQPTNNMVTPEINSLTSTTGSTSKPPSTTLTLQEVQQLLNQRSDIFSQTPQLKTAPSNSMKTIVLVDRDEGESIELEIEELDQYR